MNRSRRFWDDFKSFAFSGSLLKVAVAFVLATPGELRALRSAVQPVYDRYLETRPTGDFVRRIQAMKASMTGVAPVLDPSGEYAVEAALKIKDATGAKVTVISLGANLLREAVKKPLSMGADDLILLEEAAFEGGDRVLEHREGLAL